MNDRRTFSWYKWLIRLITAAFIVSVLLATVVIYFVVEDLTATYTGVGLNPFNPTDRQATEVALPDATPTIYELQVTPHPWDGKARVTLLVLGIDYRDWETGAGAPRSDTMMLVTLDPITMQAGMLSVPRDLWVEIPGFRHNRINTAYMLGEAYKLPGGGPALAMKTVERVIGVPIDFYAVVDFHTFERMVDEIGGVTVDVKQKIKISPIGRISKWLFPGDRHLDGPDTLAYARLRKGAGGDFGRAERQQEVLRAIMDRVISLDMLPTLVSKAPVLYQELSTGVRTNMSLDQIVSLAWLAVKIPEENIRQGVIGPPKMVGFYTRPDGAQVLRPIPDEIRVLRDRVFTETSAFGPVIDTIPVQESEP